MGPDSGGATVGRAVTRRTVLAGAGALAGAAAVAPAADAARQKRAAIPRHGRAAAEVFGRVIQDGADVTGFGIVTRLAGIPDGALFRGDERTESAARVTFSAATQVRERFSRNGLFSATLVGTVDFYLDGDGGDIDAPASFADGRLIASFRARIQNVLTVIAPDHAITTLEGELVQRRASSFSVGGRRRRFGRHGLPLRLWATGPGTRTDATTPRAVFEVGGRIDGAP